LGMLFVLLCAACKQPTIVYDSGEETLQIPETEISKEENETVLEQNTVEKETAEQLTMVCVYVCGEVQVPGVYEIPAAARVVDAVEAAGGMTEAADTEYLNLAETITDGQKIKVPSREEAEELEASERRQEKENQKTKDGRVNINTATKEELMTLTGIGESKARDILEYREKHGGFSNTEELMQIPGIKSGVFQKIKDKITV